MGKNKEYVDLMSSRFGINLEDDGVIHCKQLKFEDKDTTDPFEKLGLEVYMSEFGQYGGALGD